jgi:hypothetical protein
MLSDVHYAFNEAQLLAMLEAGLLLTLIFSIMVIMFCAWEDTKDE